MYNIAIIGAGSLGSRHLQGAKLAKIAINLYVVDVNLSSLSLAKERYEEVDENEFPKTVTYLDSLDKLPSVLDVVIIATNSAVRSTIILNLIQTRDVRAFLLEKFLFQSEAEFFEVENALSKNNINCQINCGRRLFAGYKKLKEEISDDGNIIFNASGSNWGIGCNSIHFIDLFAYLTDSYNVKIDTMSGLSPDILESKRKGYVEFVGSITGKNEKGCVLTLTSSLTPSIPVAITIQNKNKSVFIKEESDKIFIINNGDSKLIKEEKIGIKNQSQLTGIVLEDIISGACGLTSYKESMELHLTLLRPLLSFYNSSLKLNEIRCPIT